MVFEERVNMTAIAISPKAKKKLKFYVYVYRDPRDGKIFYVGKGRGSRMRSHLRDRRLSKKVKLIRELRKLNLQPSIEILKYGLTEEHAHQIESAAIDLLGLNELTNIVKGHSRRGERLSKVEDLLAVLNDREAKIREPAILINIARSYRPGLSAQELYDFTRSCWKLNDRRTKKAKFAMAIYRGIVREVYSIAGWFRGGETMRASDKDGYRRYHPDRLEFVGKVAEPKIRKKYIGKSVRRHVSKSQNPIHYVNCS